MLYIPWHLHTTKASVGDSIIKIPKLVEKAKKLNLPVLCSTNHGSMSDMYDFYFECINNNIKPILGCEVYTTKDRNIKDKEHKTTGHLILLAKSNLGLKNLLTITADSQLVGYYYKPRTDLNFLKETDTTDIVATTACVGSEINQLILKDEIEEAKEMILEYKNIFKDFYLEIQPGDFDKQRKVNTILIELSKELSIPLVATNDVHYLEAEDYLTHDAHVKSNRKMKKSDDSLCYPDKCYYLMTREELKNSLLAQGIEEEIVKEAIDNTLLLMDSNINIDVSELNLPTFQCPEKFSPKSYLEYICIKKLNKIKDKIKDVSEYTSRMYFELDVIEKLGFTSYFLIVRDFMEYARKEDIPYGPGRGSVCGSLVAYLAELVQIDPIKYNLLFDRFLSVHRTGSIPDVDSDFGSAQRHLMFEYVVNKYGTDHCAAVSTFQMRKARSAIKDACRILDIEEANEIAKLIPQVYYEDDGDKLTDLSIEDSLRVNPKLQEYKEIYPEMFDMAIKMEDLPRAASIHAAGTLIAKTPLHDLVPMIKKSDSILNATSFDLSQAEKMKLVKYDFLGLATLNVIDSTEKSTKDKFDREFDKFDDEKVWDLIGSRNTTGLFQIASRTYKQRMWRLKPKSIEELAACLALVRGPCISAKTDEEYMQILEGKREVRLIHPIYDEAVKDTNGIMIYQEQLMECCHNFGLPLHVCYDIMKAASKKKFEKLESYEKELWELAQKKNMDKETFDIIFKIIVDSGLYSFNKSHAVAYAVICYMTAYYKIYYPKEYLAAEFTNIYETVAADKKKARLEETVKEARRLGIKFKPVSVSKSSWEFTVEEDEIRIGLCAISAFGYKAYEALEKALLNLEDKENIEDIYEEIDKSACNKRAFNALIFAGAFGDPTNNYNRYCKIREEEPTDEVYIHNSLRLNIYDDDREMEDGLLGYNFIHCVTNSLEPINFENVKKNQVIDFKALVTRVSKKKDKNKDIYAFLTLETGDGAIEGIMFADTYSKFKSYAKKDILINVKAKKNNKECCIIVEAS